MVSPLAVLQPGILYATEDDSTPRSFNPKNVGRTRLWISTHSELVKKWKCLHCCFLTRFGSTDMMVLRRGVNNGNRCCTIVLEAILAWNSHAGRSLEKVEITPWMNGYDDRTSNETFGNSIVLRWPTSEAASSTGYEYDPGVVLNLFFIEGFVNPDEQAQSFSDFLCHGPIDNATDLISLLSFPVHSVTSGDTASQKTLGIIKEWIRTCVSHHSHYCLPTAKTPLPKRVLELHHGRFYLREILGIQQKYACLSHCWGAKGLSFMLTQDTIEILKAGRPISDLPQTFRDAMHLCLRLEIRFIWIDALCIIQGDEDDWREAAQTMASIYENSFITIAATHSADSNGGCFSKLDGTALASKLASSNLHVCERRGEDFPLSNFALLSDSHTWPLLRRAWVFQERHLSNRIVHFTKSQVVWECCSSIQSEDGYIDEDWSKGNCQSKNRNTSFRLGDTSFKSPSEDTILFWQQAVAQYSRLQLTFEQDRLPAIAAIVQRAMRSRRNDRYVAGMWRSSLLQDAAWHRFEKEGVGRSRPATSAPTWSWASVMAAVEFYDVSILSSAQLVDLTLSRVGPEHVGDVRDATIRLRGPVLTTSLHHTGMNTADMHVNMYLYDIRPDIPGSYRHLKPMLWCFEPDYDLRTGDKPVNLELMFHILFVWRNLKQHRWFGLVLRQVSENHYERIGICNLSHFSPNNVCQYMIDSLPVKDFNIV